MPFYTVMVCDFPGCTKAVGVCGERKWLDRAEGWQMMTTTLPECELSDEEVQNFITLCVQHANLLSKQLGRSWSNDEPILTGPSITFVVLEPHV